MKVPLHLQWTLFSPLKSVLTILSLTEVALLNVNRGFLVTNGPSAESNESMYQYFFTIFFTLCCRFVNFVIILRELALLLVFFFFNVADYVSIV